MAFGGYSDLNYSRDRYMAHSGMGTGMRLRKRGRDKCQGGLGGCCVWRAVWGELGRVDGVRGVMANEVGVFTWGQMRLVLSARPRFVL